MCAGTPIGSDAYMTEVANEKADVIISELKKLTEAAVTTSIG